MGVPYCWQGKGVIYPPGGPLHRPSHACPAQVSPGGSPALPPPLAAALSMGLTTPTHIHSCNRNVWCTCSVPDASRPRATRARRVGTTDSEPMPPRAAVTEESCCVNAHRTPRWEPGSPKQLHPTSQLALHPQPQFNQTGCDIPGGVPGRDRALAEKVQVKPELFNGQVSFLAVTRCPGDLSW